MKLRAEKTDTIDASTCSTVKISMRLSFCSLFSLYLIVYIDDIQKNQKREAKLFEKSDND